MLAAVPAQAQVTTNIYSGHARSGGGTPFSGLVGTLKTPAIQFGTNTGDNWHPFGLSDFGADSTGLLNVAGGGSETFNLRSDDGSVLLIDGTQIIDNGGLHESTGVLGTVNLSAGLHTFEVQFFENGVGNSGLDLSLPAGVTYAPVPEASTTVSLGLLLALGMGGLVFAAKRKKASTGA